MTVQQMLDEIDLAGYDDLEESDKLLYINRAAKAITNREPWAFREKTQDLTSANWDTATGEVDLTDLSFTFGGLMDIINTSASGYPIRFIRRDEHYKHRSASLTETGTPFNFFFVGKRLFLWPVPTSGTFRITYLAHQGDLVAASAESAILLPAQWHEAIVAGALYRINMREDDPENAAMFKSAHDELLESMRQDLEKVQWDSPDSILVYEDDWYED